MPPLAQIFGIRHFSPAGALLLRRFLDEKNPKVVLIEGPSDATAELKHLVHKKTRPPVAVLAFTKSRPVRNIVFPLAAYSPEWIALRWALERKREVRFIDLPAAVFLELQRLEDEEARKEAERLAAEADAPGTGAHAADGAADAADAAEEEEAPKLDTATAVTKERDDSQAYLDDPYEAIAAIAGEKDHETWWERHFEHMLDVDAYRDSLLHFGGELRELRSLSAKHEHEGIAELRRRAHERETLLREAFMRREIRNATDRPEDAVVVCGAFHAAALDAELEPMSDAEAKKLVSSDCVLTLMPYSYVRLSSQSGYGAGNHAPAYFEALFEEALAGRPERLPARYLAEIAHRLRRQGNIRSSAEVIEAVRLAEALAAMNGSYAPALRDLRDAARTLLGQGEMAPLDKALREIEIGTAIGELPPGVSRTALQDDFHQLVKTLKLEKYLEDKEQGIELDLREDRFKKTKEAAFLDRHRSTFLNRLSVLDIGFAKEKARAQKGTAKESWSLRWTPECEIRLAERSLQADSIEAGASFLLAERLGEAENVGKATDVLLLAANCELADALTVALRRVQQLAVDDAAFASIGLGAQNISELIRYGNVRDVDPEPLRPILSQLYLRGTLLVYAACVCDDNAESEIRDAVDRLHTVAWLGEEGIDPEGWMDAVRQVAESDSRNPFLSGYATALLIERGRMDDGAIDREISRRLSPGTEASVGVGWFEGLVQRNRAALFMRPALWACLSSYVDGLDDEQFKRALLFLRRAFSSFDQSEVRRVVSLLAEAWKGEGAQVLAREVEKKLDQAEIDKVTEDLGGLDLL